MTRCAPAAHLALAMLRAAATPGGSAASDCQGHVTGTRVVRRVEHHPDSPRVWQPLNGQRQKERQAFSAMTNRTKDGTVSQPRTHIHCDLKLKP